MAVGLGPSWAAIDGSGNVYVSNSTEGTVSRITAATGVVSKTTNVGTGPAGICWDNAGHMYVANYGAGSGTVSMISTPAGVVLNTISVGSGPTSGPFGVVYDGTSRVWAALSVDNKVAWIPAL